MAIEVKQWDHHRKLCINLFIVGIHGSHGTLLIDSLADLSAILRFRPWSSRLLVVGDWNVDLLPSLVGDHWQSQLGRDLHHADRRAALYACLDAFKLDLHVPERVVSVADGFFF